MGRLFRRGRIWYTWVPQDGGGVRRVSTNCTDRKAAATQQAKLERQAANPAHAAQTEALTVELLDALLRALTRRNRAKATYSFNAQKAGHLRRLLPRRASLITHAVLERYIDTRLSEGAARTTIKKELGVLRAALRIARRNGLFARDTGEVLPELEDDYVPRKRALTRKELESLCGYLSARRGAHVAFIVATGARWGESLRARSADVSDDRAFVHLRGTKTVRSLRDVAIPPAMRSILSWSLDRAGSLPFDGWGNVRRDLRIACEAVGIEPCSPNDLRRTHATWLQAAGVDNGIIASQLGHTTSRMVELAYGRMSPADRGLLLEEKTGGRLMGGVGHDEIASGASGENAFTVNQWPGPESNRRHADFQSSPIGQETTSNVALSADRWVANGNDSCLTPPGVEPGKQSDSLGNSAGSEAIETDSEPPSSPCDRAKAAERDASKRSCLDPLCDGDGEVRFRAEGSVHVYACPTCSGAGVGA